MKQSSSFNFLRTAPIGSLVLLTVLGGGIESAQATTCSTIFTVPASAPTSLYTNTALDACFDNATTMVTTNTGIRNNGGLTSVGTLRSTGYINNYGSFDNDTGATLGVKRFTNYAGGSFQNRGTMASDAVSGLITNQGQFKNLAGATLNNKRDFDNSAGGVVTNAGVVNNDRSVVNSGTLTNEAGGVINNFKYLTVAAGGVLNNNGVINNMRAPMAWESPGDGIRVEGKLTNNGVINSNMELTVVAGAVLDGSGTIQQTGSTVSVNGTLTQTSLTMQGGNLEGRGTIHADVFLEDAYVSPKYKAGGSQFTVDGDLTAVDSVINMAFHGAGADEVSVFNVTGVIDLTNVSFNLWFSEAATQTGNSWIFLRGDTTGLTLDQLHFQYILPLQATAITEIVAEGIKVTLLDVVPVPVPGAAWLFGSALAGVVAVARRKSSIR